jgi:hypothetical protein
MRVRVAVLGVTTVLILACGLELDTGPIDTAPPNNLPTAPSIHIEPAQPTSMDELVVVIDADSTDADNEAITYQFLWQLDGKGAGVDTETLLHEETARGDEWQVSVFANDGRDDGDIATATVKIRNAPPVLEDLTISPDPAMTLDNLNCVTDSGYDADGDSITYSYAWMVNGTGAGSGPSLSSSSTQHLDLVTCVAIPDDGTAEGPPASANLTVSNAPPSAPGVSIQGAATLLCQVDSESYDADGHDSTYTVRWENNGVSHTGTTTTAYWPNDTVPSTATTTGETWTCHVTPNDGYDDGSEGNSSGVVIINEPHTYVITNAMLSGLTSECSTGDPRPYNACNKNWGFSWTDTEGNTPSEIDVELALGVMCDSGTRQVQLNGTNIGTFSASDDCNCSGTLDQVSINASTASSWNTGGTNTLTVVYNGSCEGLQHNPSWGSDAYARVTLNY